MKKTGVIQSTKRLPRLILLVLVICLAPVAQAKKDLFGQTSDSNSNKSDAAASSAAAQLPALTVELPPPPEPELTIVEQREQAAQKKSQDDEPPKGLWGNAKSGIIHLRDEIFDFKDNLIGKPKSKKAPVSTSVPIGFQSAAPEYTAFETKLTPTDAVKKALSMTEGQVMNLRMYREGERTLYSVKLLQKDGRMRSIYLDANTGEQYEYAIEPIEE